MENVIYLEFLGVVRLLVGKKEAALGFQEEPTLNGLMEELAKKYGEEVKQECLNQMIVLQSSGSSDSRQLKWPEDRSVQLQKDSRVRFISVVTGG